MRLAGEIPVEILDLIATDTSNWPTIKQPVPVVPAEYKYDEHMKEYVPNLPVQLKKA